MTNDVPEKVNDLEELQVTFKNGALENLKRLAARFDLSADEDLEKVVAKAVKLLTYVKDAKDNRVSFKNSEGDGFFVDIEKL